METQTLLVVDDQPSVLTMTARILRDHYIVKVAKSGVEALKIVNSGEPPELILLDIGMPEMDGFEVLKRLKANQLSSNIPVIFLTGRNNEKDEEKGLLMGAVDYITKPISSTILEARVKNQLLLKHAQDYLIDKNAFLQKELERRAQENRIIQQLGIRALAHLAQARDSEAGQHMSRTQLFATRLGRILVNHAKYQGQLTKHYIDMMCQSVPLHDIGKVGIPDNILLKPASLTAHERRLMTEHAELGAKAIELAEQDVPYHAEYLSFAKQIAHWHHEHWDGSGYPDGLKGEDIPLCARIVAVADVFDALISGRVYREAMNYDQAKAVLLKEKGSHFDPDIIDAFIEHYDEFIELAEAPDK